MSLSLYFDRLEVVERFSDQLMHLWGESELFNKNGERCGRVEVDMPAALVEKDGITLLGSDTVTGDRPRNREERRRESIKNSAKEVRPRRFRPLKT